MALPAGVNNELFLLPRESRFSVEAEEERRWEETRERYFMARIMVPTLRRLSVEVGMSLPNLLRYFLADAVLIEQEYPQGEWVSLMLIASEREDQAVHFFRDNWQRKEQLLEMEANLAAPNTLGTQVRWWTESETAEKTDLR